MRDLLFGIALTMCGSAVHAASVELQPMGPGQPDLIYVSGELELGDAETFRAVAERTSKAIVMLSGPGGSVAAGITIGEIIRLKNFDTLVADQAFCASACALAWLGGPRRHMSASAKVGFHAASDMRSGQVSGMANALIGAYLNRIGLPVRAIAYMTVAEPDTMVWLTQADAASYGIDVSILATPPGRATTAPGKTDAGSGLKQAREDAPAAAAATAPALEQEAVEFVRNHFAAQSAPAELSTRLLWGQYSDIVLYYGKYVQRQAIINDYQTFVARWPERWYSLRLDSITVQCQEASQLCTVGAIADWVAISRARAKKSTGHSLWTIGVRRHASGFIITSVSGDVLQRDIVSLAR